MIITTRRVAALSSATLLAGGLLLSGAAAANATGSAGSHDPYGNVDQIAVAKDGAAIAGWAADPDNPKMPLEIHLTVDHKYTVKGKSGISRPDVQKKRHTGPNQGFVAAAHLSRGTHVLCLGVINIGPGSEAYPGCFTVKVK